MHLSSCGICLGFLTQLWALACGKSWQSFLFLQTLPDQFPNEIHKHPGGFGDDSSFFIRISYGVRERFRISVVPSEPSNYFISMKFSLWHEIVPTLFHSCYWISFFFKICVLLVFRAWEFCHLSFCSHLYLENIFESSLMKILSYFHRTIWFLR